MKYPYLLLFPLVLLASCAEEELGITPTRGSITESVYASGSIKAGGQYTVLPMVSGILTEILVRPGDSVQAGQPIALLRDATAALNGEQARLVLELTREQAATGSDRLLELEENVRLARAAYAMDSSLAVRQQRLWDQQIGSRIELEQRQLALANARATYFNARRRYSDVKRQLENTLKQSEVSYRRNLEVQSDFTLKSAIAGRVFDVLREPGELVSPQSAVAVIGDPGDYLIELRVDEYDITRIREGQSVLVTMDSYDDEVFRAVVTRILPIMNERSRTFVVEARFEEVPPTLYPNLTVEANIVIQHKEDALIVPAAYLMAGGYVRTGENDSIAVSTGLRDYEQVEITGGIDASTIIYAPGKR